MDVVYHISLRKYTHIFNGFPEGPLPFFVK